MHLNQKTASVPKPLWKCTPRIIPCPPTIPRHIKFPDDEDTDLEDTACPSPSPSTLVTTPTEESNVYNGFETCGDEVKMYESCLREMWGEDECDGWLSSDVECHDEDEDEDMQEPSEGGFSDAGGEIDGETDEEEIEEAVNMQDTRILAKSHHRFDFPSPEEVSDDEYEYDNEEEDMQEEEDEVSTHQDTHLMEAPTRVSHHPHQDSSSSAADTADWLVAAVRNETRELGLELFETRVELQCALDRMVDRIEAVQEKMDAGMGVAGGKRKRVTKEGLRIANKWHTKAVEDVMEDVSEDEEDHGRVKKIKTDRGVAKKALWTAASLVAGAVIGVAGVGLLF
ncbi:hypothetical protein HDU98_010623 [Podochytrium sp. JEL0797]|nr:hypothetical protein HDU98_010623 [Podochytrium sp. JEL0797]